MRPAISTTSGEEVLSNSIGPSKAIEENIMLNENEMVTLVLKAKAVTDNEMDPENTEVLNISVIDPQNKESFWEKSFTATAKSGKTIDFFSFTPESSGIHHIKISNADFETDVKLVSGMINPGTQPLFWKTLIASCLVAFIGIFLVRESGMRSKSFALGGMISSSIYLAISLRIVYNVVI